MSNRGATRCRGSRESHQCRSPGHRWGRHGVCDRHQDTHPPGCCCLRLWRGRNLDGYQDVDTFSLNGGGSDIRIGNREFACSIPPGITRTRPRLRQRGRAGRALTHCHVIAGGTFGHRRGGRHIDPPRLGHLCGSLGLGGALGRNEHAPHANEREEPYRCDHDSARHALST